MTVLVVGLTATAGAAVGFDQSQVRDRETRFDAAASRARSRFERRIELYTAQLTELRNAILIDSRINRMEFHDLIALGLDTGLYSGVQAVAVVRRVKAADRSAFEAAAQQEVDTLDRYPPFVIHPATNAAESYVVTYIEPLEGNEAAYGLDLASLPDRIDALEAARDTGDLVGTPPIRLVSETGDQSGFLLFAPTYDTGDIPSTGPARRRHTTGTVSMAFRIGDMFAGILETPGANPEVDAEVYDVGDTIDAPTNPDRSSTPILDTMPGTAFTSGGRVGGLHRFLDLNVGGRRWRMVVTPAEGFPSGHRRLGWIVGSLGVLLSALLAGVVHVTTQARGRAERRAAQMTADLRAAEKRTRSIIHGAPDAMVVVGGDGRITDVNLATEALFGYPASELVGQPIEVLLPEELADRHRAHRAGYLAAPHRREMGAGLELLGRRRDGTTLPVEVSLSPLVGEDGSVEVIAAVRDVSERRRAKAVLQAAYDQERASTARLREADDLKTTFLNTISHELRTPLTAITGFTNVMLASSLDDERRTDFLQRIHRNAQNLSTLILEVLAFAGRGDAEAVLAPTELDVAAESKLVCDQLSPILDAHTLVVKAREPVQAFVDRGAFTRVLTNLLTNAARYAPPATTITISAQPRSDRVVVSVTDEGPGIPVDERDRVFEPFFRGSMALASRTPGTGIGLAVVKDLVERSGGSVDVRTASSGGAQFDVDLPGGASGARATTDGLTTLGGP